jgi:phosphatidylserine/phosphatidylglycerophosphate/cardiolipin synthase-like enzyme
VGATTAFDVHFGGPDHIPGQLRDVLAERVAAVPAGGSIDWVVYYFRDRRLACDLVEAKKRGVDVRVTVDGHPRASRANDSVIAILESGLGSGLRVVRHPLDRLTRAPIIRTRLHEKLYCFSHPKPIALVGSFNPSTDEPEQEPQILDEIGNHSLGYNMLVELRDEFAVSRLTEHARWIHSEASHSVFARFDSASNRSVVLGGTELYFWPRVTAHPIERRLRNLPTGSRVRMAASHLKGAITTRTLLELTRRGVSIEILTEDSERRVPRKFESRLRAAGIRIQRVVHSEMAWTPMHDKFLLLESDERRTSVFGSFNWNMQSRYLNRELGISSDDPSLFDAFANRWDMLQKYAV